MPRVSPLQRAASTLAACAEQTSLDSNGLNNGLVSNLTRMKTSYSGFGEGVCTCARCMRRAGPIREDVENKLVQITYALANAYDDSPDLEMRVTDEHRARAEVMMACVESGDVTQLREAFLEIEEQEAEGLLEGGTATEIATYLIISAAQVGQPEVIRLLAEWDADMEETDSIRRGRPLMHAANNGHTAAVKALVECGADPEATDDNGYTALMVAVFSDRSSAAEALLDGGACVDTLDRAGRTALSYAAMYGSTDCIYLLAARGADVAHIDHDGNTPLELAEGSGRQSAVDALKKLQLRVKMQEKRKVKQSKCRAGCLDLDAAQLEAKEQEAARAAAELLEQLEKEQAAKVAKAAKKKKKGKSKAASHDCQTSETSDSHQLESAAYLMAGDDAHHEQLQQHGLAQVQVQVQEKQQAGEVLAALSNGTNSKHSKPHLQQQNSSGSSAAADWAGSGPGPRSTRGSLELTDEEPGSAKLGGQTGEGRTVHPRKQPKQAPAASPGGAASKQQHQHHHHHHATSNGTEQQADQQHSSRVTATASSEPHIMHHQAPLSRRAGPSSLALFQCDSLTLSSESVAAEVTDELDMLRREWEALLEVAARCRDPQQQPTMLTRVAAMLQRCVDAGISVKYGRKVLQRLQAVGPARSALQAALGSRTVVMDELEAALGACKSCRCLLEEELVQHADEVLVQLQREHQEQQIRVQQEQMNNAEAAMAIGSSADVVVAAPVAVDMSLKHQQQNSSMQLSQQEQQQSLASKLTHLPPPNSLQAQLQQALQHHMQQAQQKKQKQQQLQQQEPQQPQQKQVQQPALPSTAVQQAQPPPPPPPPPQQQQQQVNSKLQQHPPPGFAPLQPQQQHHMSASVGMQQLKQQQQQHMQQSQQTPHASQQQLPFQQQHQQQQVLPDRQLLPAQLQMAMPGQQHVAVTAGVPVPPLLSAQQQQRQPSMSQLQLQQLFASQLQNSQLQGRAGSGMMMSPVGTPPVLGGPGNLLQHQLLTPVSQAPVSRLQGQGQVQQQQQQLGGYGSWSGSGLVASGSFGSAASGVLGSAGSGLQLHHLGDLLPPQQSVLPASMGLSTGAGLSPAPGELRRNSLSSNPVASVAQVLLSSPADVDVLDDAQHPAFAMANALLSDDEREPTGAAAGGKECSVCHSTKANTCCLPCGCMRMCQACALHFRRQDRKGMCPFCLQRLDDLILVA